jgi:hypothetical protein
MIRASAGKIDSTTRTADQTRIGIFWAYDGGFRIGVPPRLYNSIADDIIIDYLVKGEAALSTGFQLVKLYAMINVALADAGVSVRVPTWSFTITNLKYCLRNMRTMLTLAVSYASAAGTLLRYLLYVL